MVMKEVQFAVSAKTARLIGRENISDVDGAVIELIKNAYDADATCVYLQLYIPFPDVPQTISYDLANSALNENELTLLLQYYDNSTKQLVKRKDLSQTQEQELHDFLFAHNRIVVMDNGCGMTEEILRTAWMNIGTNEKEERKVSSGGRIKTGAKGIGRFALDKLSTATTVYTKSNEDSLKKWEINWRQFDSAVMLEEVSATIEDTSGSYKALAQELARDNIKSFDEYLWDTGTLIILNPTREKWSVQYFAKINRNLRSLFPGTNDSHFDIYVDNVFYPSYSFANERFSLATNDYDYRITSNFDGVDTLTVNLSRNEIDNRKIKVIREVDGQDHDLKLSDFWARDSFQREKYYRADYSKEVSFSFSVSSLTKLDSSIIRLVGPFQTELYFLKNTPSPIEIAKPIITTRRKEILQNYSGIKIYRDGFKVRPYGEDGSGFDWLGLNERVIKSPGAVSRDGAWRVRANQIIGAVRISKEGNPNLADMANREGLAINDAYTAFALIIEKVIETFEGDRQYVQREYALWLKSKEEELSSSQKIINHVSKQPANVDDTRQPANKKTESSNSDYSRQEYQRAILDLKDESQRKDRALKTMMLYSSAGVMANTFSHEISRIATNAGSRMQQLRYTIKRLVGDSGYVGNPIFNPFSIIDQIEKVDGLLESWLEVIMSGAEQSAYEVKEINLIDTIQKILDLWEPLLSQKLISIIPITIIGESKECKCMISEVDLHIILNNYLLNSAWFLEKATVQQRQVSITVDVQKEKIVILLENNGPPLDGMFSNNPERIFHPGESSKVSSDGEGTGLGLWIVKTLVDEASGEIHPMEKADGFGLRITLPK